MSQHTTVVIDFSVFAHQLYNNYVAMGAMDDKEHWHGILKAQATWMMSCKWLGCLQSDPDKTQVVMVTDTKPYWRTEYLQRPEVYEKILAVKRGKEVFNTKPIAYKGGRKFPEYGFTKTKEQLTKFCIEQGFKMLSCSGYEADDLAAAIVMMNRMLPRDQQHRIIMATVDADWMGLIDQNTTWFCSYGYQPRVRHLMVDINSWAIKRLKTELKTPKDIWEIKTRQGDKSDNLPAGSPIEVISLIEPPLEHRLWLQPGYNSVIRNILQKPEGLSEKVLDRVEPACIYLRSLGLTRFVKPYDPTDTRQPFAEAA